MRKTFFQNISTVPVSGQMFAKNEETVQIITFINKYRLLRFIFYAHKIFVYEKNKLNEK